MGTSSSEGLLTATLDRDQLRAVWETGAEPVRSRMPVGLFASYLPAMYSSRRSLADAWPEESPVAPLPEASAAESPDAS